MPCTSVARGEWDAGSEWLELLEGDRVRVRVLLGVRVPDRCTRGEGWGNAGVGGERQSGGVGKTKHHTAAAHSRNKNYWGLVAFPPRRPAPHKHGTLLTVLVGERVLVAVPLADDEPVFDAVAVDEIVCVTVPLSEGVEVLDGVPVWLGVSVEEGVVVDCAGRRGGEGGKGL